MTGSQYLSARKQGWLAASTVQFLADYPDAHDFAFTFYWSDGAYASAQGYSNATMDTLIQKGIRTPDGAPRAAIYTQIQQLAIDDCPSVALVVELGRHFELSWIVDWYYNPLYQGNYVANTWKWYYTPHAQMNTVTGPVSNHLPYDVNYDGKINMIDIGTTAASWISNYGWPMLGKWVFRCDFNVDRKIDMKDIGIVASRVWETSAKWTPPP